MPEHFGWDTFLSVIFNHAITSGTFPAQFLEAVVFFLFKKGDRSTPGNYRSIVLENPVLKVLSSALTKRINDFAEQNNLFPLWQFDYCKNRSTIGAASLLHDVIHERLKCKKRTYVCFIDFSKCFDSIRRDILFTKLQILGIPFDLCKLLHFIFSHMTFVIKSGNMLTKKFKTLIGLPQGDPLSAVLFSLFVFDLPNCLPHPGPALHGILIPYIMFADDLAILAESPQEL